MLEKILVPLDGSPLAERILVHVRRLLHVKDGRVLLAHVVPIDAPPAEVEDARARLERLRAELAAQGAMVEARVVSSAEPVADALLGLAREWGPGLIALSTHGRGGVSRLVRGSIAEELLRRSSDPVLVANPRAFEADEARIRRILVPLDGSETSAAILPAASALARVYGSEVVLLHALEVVLGSLDFPIFEAVDEAQRMLARMARRVESVPVRTRVVQGAAAMVIFGVAIQENADLIAMTTHGRTGLSRLALGSVAEEIARASPCPLLVQRMESLEAAKAPRIEAA
jgi:nucleotide-binding universal stress UspA family protein